MCSLQKRGRVYILTLLGEGDHRFNPSSIDSISAALKTVQESPDAGALVTTNEGRYFSNGLDLNWIVQNPEASRDIIRLKFENLLASLMRVRVPTIAAIRGHAAAGGMVVALAHDYRFMARGSSVLYMSELDHGMRMPHSLMAVIRSKLLPGPLRDVMLNARKFTPEAALQAQLVDLVCEDSAQTLEVAIREAEKLAGRNWEKDVYCSLRLGAFPGVVEELEAHRDPYVWRPPSKL